MTFSKLWKQKREFLETAAKKCIQNHERSGFLKRIVFNCVLVQSSKKLCPNFLGYISAFYELSFSFISVFFILLILIFWFGLSQCYIQSSSCQGFHGLPSLIKSCPVGRDRWRFLTSLIIPLLSDRSSPLQKFLETWTIFKSLIFSYSQHF